MENNTFKKINFKDKKYILPLIALPFVLFIGYQIIDFIDNEEEVGEQKIEELSTNIGEVRDSIMTKNDAYDAFFQKDENNYTNIEDLEKESDSLFTYTDVLTEKEKRRIDSINFFKSQKRNNNINLSNRNNAFTKEIDDKEDEDYNRSLEMIKALNGQGFSDTENKKENSQVEEEDEDEDPISIFRKQMFFMDSLEHANNPEYQEKLRVEKRLKENEKKMKDFLSNTHEVKKSALGLGFNHISRQSENNIIQAVIDENIKGYLGSRIRIRLLEDVYVNNKKIKKGSFLYALISGFSLQRVNLSIVSVMVDGEILPINLTIYDLDGMKGLYVPASAFREMMREFGSNSMQGTSLEQGSENFFTSLASQLFQSTSQTIANLIRKNKAKIKYNTQILLINEKKLRNEKN